jgi:hypothetical protein
MSSKTALKETFSLDHLNAWRMHTQWLDRPFKGRGLLDLMRSIGWIYSPGCSTPYLSIWARTSRFRPSTLDRLVFKDRKLVQLDTLRGCTMLVPREQAPIALRVRSQRFTELSRQAKPLMPITDPEMEKLKKAVIQALAGQTRTYEDLLDEVPAGLVRDFPPSLRRYGLAGSLWLAINLLKEEGRIVRLQAARRLDTPEYSFALLSDLLPDTDLFSLKPEHANVELAAEYFLREGPARVRDFAWWAGIHVTEAMRALEEVSPSVVSVRVQGSRDPFFMSSSLVEEFRDFSPPQSPVVNFIPYRDIYLKGQREVVDRFVPSRHYDKPFLRLSGKLMNDPLATVIRDGRVVGVWDWDPDAGGRLDFELFEEDLSRGVKSRIARRAKELDAFITESLGQVRLQGFDYGRHQMTRIRDLKRHWGQGASVDVAVARAAGR